MRIKYLAGCDREANVKIKESNSQLILMECETELRIQPKPHIAETIELVHVTQEELDALHEWGKQAGGLNHLPSDAGAWSQDKWKRRLKGKS